MDKSWISLKERTSMTYVKGVFTFLDFAFLNSSRDSKILCPCHRCVNAFLHTKSVVLDHLLWNGFQKNYVNWTYHGETSAVSNANDCVIEEVRAFDHDIDGLLGDAFMDVSMEETDEANTYEEGLGSDNGINVDPSSPPIEKHKIFELVKDAGEPLYPECPESKLAAVLMLYHLKCLHGWTNKSFTQLLEYLKFLLPKGNVLPKSHYETKKIVKALNLGYEKIHACPNDCMLFWKEKKDEDFCSVCGSSRWVLNGACDKDVEDSSAEIPSTDLKRKPAKVLRWFPLKPRLQRLFMCSETSAYMRWHDEGRTKDSFLRHPSDSKAWKDFFSRYPKFAAENRNVVLGIAADGVNPFQNMNVSHSTWPVVVIPYNLPPWLCMKQTNFILTLLIPGPKSPGQNIDVYLQPLIEELEDLWTNGIETWDASKNETFTMRAALLWTVGDFMGLAIMSGWSTQGEYACPCCGYNTESLWLNNSGKKRNMGGGNIQPRCPFCDEAEETAYHLFFSCRVSYAIWMAILKWWGLYSALPPNCREHFNLFCGLIRTKKQRKPWIWCWFQAVWSLWLTRNEVIFDNKILNQDNILELIKVRLWWLCRAKLKGFYGCMSQWLMDPKSCI